MKYSIVFGYRDRETDRVKRCLDSLAGQQFRDFEIVFTDYGSSSEYAKQIAALCASYPLVNFIRNETQGRPWNRGHALNTGVRHAKGDYIIFGDVDMIYSKSFLSSLDGQEGEMITLYGECVMLAESFSDWDSLSESNGTEFRSFGKAGKGGVHIISRRKLEEIGSYDEFYCFWGVEDRDLNHRLTSIGLQEKWIEKQAPVFHQWHPSTSDFYRSGFPLCWWEDMNLYFWNKYNSVKRNQEDWGNVLSKNDRVAVDSSLEERIVKLECKDVIYGPGGKTATIGTIGSSLNELTAGIRMVFVYEGEPESESIVATKIFSRMLVDEKRFEEHLKQVDQFRKRMNHFIPEEDLKYIFWKLVRSRPELDYAFEVGNGVLKWTFAKSR